MKFSIDVPFENLIEPLDDDNGAQQFNTDSPLKSENQREINSENIFGIEDFRYVHKETLAIRKPVSINRNV